MSCYRYRHCYLSIINAYKLFGLLYDGRSASSLALRNSTGSSQLNTQGPSFCALLRAHDLRSTLTSYARDHAWTTPALLLDHDRATPELLPLRLDHASTTPRPRQSYFRATPRLPQAQNLRSGAHRPRSRYGFIAVVQGSTDNNALLNSWSASTPTRPLRHRWFGRHQLQQVFFDFTKHRLWRRH